jgi:hypothetical protein
VLAIFACATVSYVTVPSITVMMSAMAAIRRVEPWRHAEVRGACRSLRCQPARLLATCRRNRLPCAVSRVCSKLPSGCRGERRRWLFVRWRRLSKISAVVAVCAASFFGGLLGQHLVCCLAALHFKASLLG